MCKMLAVLFSPVLIVVFGGVMSVEVCAQDLSCANVNGDAVVDIGDVTYLLDWLFLGGPPAACPEPPGECGNLNADERVDVSDAVYLLSWLFLGGPAPQCATGPLELDGFTSLGENAEGLAEYRHDETGIVFVLLPGGTFWMGAQGEDPDRRNYDSVALPADSPVHEVTLSPFLMAKYEVTQRQWLEVMGENPSCFRPDGVCSDRLPAELLVEERWLELPVEFVSWDDIQRFEERTGLTLPSEAQWEYACRAGTSTRFFAGGDSPGCGGNVEFVPWGCPERSELDRFMWMYWNSPSRTREVGTKLPNQFGLHDTHGNAREWCEDVASAEFYSTQEASGPDPVCTSGTENRVSRGGRQPHGGRSAARHLHNHPSERGHFLGFRPSRSLLD